MIAKWNPKSDSERFEYPIRKTNKEKPRQIVCLHPSKL